MTKFDFLRAADLHPAYQHGEATANGDTASEPEFREKFAGDEKAQAEYMRGLTEQQARQLSTPKTTANPDFSSDAFNKKAERAILSSGLIGPRDRK